MVRDVIPPQHLLAPIWERDVFLVESSFTQRHLRQRHISLEYLLQRLQQFIHLFVEKSMQIERLERGVGSEDQNCVAPAVEAVASETKQGLIRLQRIAYFLTVFPGSWSIQR